MSKKLQNKNNENDNSIIKNTNINNPKIYDVKNYFISKKSPLLSTTADRNDKNKLFINLRNKYTKGGTKCNVTFDGQFSDNPKKFLENFFGWLNKIAVWKSISQVKMYTNDILFKVIPKNMFKEFGNQILKNISIAILKEPQHVYDLAERQKIIEQNHNNPVFGGHIGTKRLYAKLRQDYIWPHMARDVANHVKNCHDCQTNKVKTHTKAPMCISDTPIKQFDKLSIDTVGPLQMTENGNKYILTVLCNLSKYLIVIPIANKEAKTVARVLVENVFLNYGLCHSILTDIGTEYISSSNNGRCRKNTPYYERVFKNISK